MPWLPEAAFQRPGISSVLALAGVAACSFLLGRYSALLKRSDDEREGKGTEAKQLPAEAQSRLSAEQIRSFLRQLPSKPLGPRGQHLDAAHSTAKLVLLCASGKGGVGKSTVSVNLAYMMKQMGLEVGLLDLDIYGPSLPELVRLPPDCVTQNEAGRIVPIDYGGVALMSWGYVNPGQANAIRAPIANQMVTQLLTMVEWGALDVLVIDTPPGTGDVLLSIAQTVAVDGAVLVTTSNTLSLADVNKGLQLFDKVDIPSSLVVRNMATICCEACNHQQQLFSDGSLSGLAALLQERNISLLDMPLDQELSKAPLAFQPSMTYAYPFVRNPHNEGRVAWAQLSRAAHVVLEAALGLEVSQGDSGGASITGTHRRETSASLRLRQGGLLEVRLPGGELRPVACGDIRATCRCAHCVDELTGEVKIDQERIRADKSLRAKGVEVVGNYAVSILWSDGHQTIVATRALVEMVGGSTHKKAGSKASDNANW